jgi:hypothetical protein
VGTHPIRCHSANVAHLQVIQASRAQFTHVAQVIQVPIELCRLGACVAATQEQRHLSSVNPPVLAQGAYHGCLLMLSSRQLAPTNKYAYL